MNDPRGIKRVHMNPANGTIFVEADDGTLWIREGSVSASRLPWKSVPQLPPINPQKEESEDDATTIV